MSVKRYFLTTFTSILLSTFTFFSSQDLIGLEKIIGDSLQTGNFESSQDYPSYAGYPLCKDVLNEIGTNPEKVNFLKNYGKEHKENMVSVNSKRPPYYTALNLIPLTCDCGCGGGGSGCFVRGTSVYRLEYERDPETDTYEIIKGDDFANKDINKFYIKEVPINDIYKGEWVLSSTYSVADVAVDCWGKVDSVFKNTLRYHKGEKYMMIKYETDEGRYVLNATKEQPFLVKVGEEWRWVRVTDKEFVPGVELFAANSDDNCIVSQITESKAPPINKAFSHLGIGNIEIFDLLVD